MPLARSIAIAAGALACLIGLRVQSSRTLVAHDFESSAHGWLVSGDTTSSEPRLHAAGGHPGGYISHVDEAVGETWYFRAPAAVLQQLAQAEHGVIRFSLRQSTNIEGGFLDDDVVIVGRAGRAGYRFGRGSAPGTAWTRFSVRLSATEGWRWNGGGPATQAQLRSVLEAPLSLEIRGEYVSGPDEAFLDNFEITR